MCEKGPGDDGSLVMLRGRKRDKTGSLQWS